MEDVNIFSTIHDAHVLCNHDLNKFLINQDKRKLSIRLLLVCLQQDRKSMLNCSSSFFQGFFKVSILSDA